MRMSKGTLQCRAMMTCVEAAFYGTSKYLQVRCASALDHVDIGAHELAHGGVEDVQVGVLRAGQALGQLLHQHLHNRVFFGRLMHMLRAQLSMQLHTVQACCCYPGPCPDVLSTGEWRMESGWQCVWEPDIQG